MAEALVMSISNLLRHSLEQFFQELSYLVVEKETIETVGRRLLDTPKGLSGLDVLAGREKELGRTSGAYFDRLIASTLQTASERAPDLPDQDIRVLHKLSKRAELRVAGVELQHSLVLRSAEAFSAGYAWGAGQLPFPHLRRFRRGFKSLEFGLPEAVRMQLKRIEERVLLWFVGSRAEDDGIAPRADTFGTSEAEALTAASAAYAALRKRGVRRARSRTRSGLALSVELGGVDQMIDANKGDMPDSLREEIGFWLSIASNAEDTLLKTTGLGMRQLEEALTDGTPEGFPWIPDGLFSRLREGRINAFEAYDVANWTSVAFLLLEAEARISPVVVRRMLATAETFAEWMEGGLQVAGRGSSSHQESASLVRSNAVAWAFQSGHSEVVEKYGEYAETLLARATNASPVLTFEIGKAVVEGGASTRRLVEV